MFKKDSVYVNAQKKKPNTFVVITLSLFIGVIYTISFYEYTELHDAFKEGVRKYEYVIENRTVKEVTEEQVESTLPALSEEEQEDDRVAQIVEGIYMMESSGGKNNYSKCEEQGKYNGYGFGIPGNGKYICFDSHEEQTEAVTKWVEKKIAQGHTEQELLCIYNTGSADECAYYENIKKFI